MWLLSNLVFLLFAGCGGVAEPLGTRNLRASKEDDEVVRRVLVGASVDVDAEANGFKKSNNTSTLRSLSETCTPPGDGVFVDESFAAPSPSVESAIIFPRLGSSIDYITSDGSDVVVVNQRTNERHGLEIDLSGFCLDPETIYIMTARVRVSAAAAAPGSLTACASDDSGCLVVKSEFMDSNGGVTEDVKYTEKRSIQTTYENWWTVSTQIDFGAADLLSTNVYHALRIEGPGDGIDIEIDDFVFRSPPDDTYHGPNPDCQDLVPGNNGADELGDSTFPFYANLDPVHVAVEEENGNRYFAVTGRAYASYHDVYDENYHWTSLAFNFPSACVSAGGVSYRFTCQLRVHSPSDVVVDVRLKDLNSDYATPSTHIDITSCPPSSGEWVSCSGEITFTVGMISPDGGEVYFQTTGAATVDIDVDDIYFEFFTPAPSDSPTPSPTSHPTPVPTNAPSDKPSPAPTSKPSTSMPTDSPTSKPSPAPTTRPTSSTPIPTASPSVAPVSDPTAQPAPKDCTELVYNGQFTSGTTQWADMYGGELTLVEGTGGPGDNAVQDFGGGLMQEIQTGCLVQGEWYQVHLKYKLKDNVGNEYDCAENLNTECPTVGLLTQLGSDSNYKTVSSAAGLQWDDGWSRMYGTFEATSLDADPSSVLTIVVDQLPDTTIVVDDVSVSEKVQQCDGELTANSDMELGHVGYWEPYIEGTLHHYGGDGSRAILYSNRTVFRQGAQYSRALLDYRCLVGGTTWEIEADFKLLQAGTNIGASCDKSETDPNNGACPTVKVWFWDASNPSKPIWKKKLFARAYDKSTPWEQDGFNKFKDFFTVSSLVVSPVKVKVMIRDFSPTLDIVFDNFVLKRHGSTRSPTASPTQGPTETAEPPPPLDNECPEVGQEQAVLDPNGRFVVMPSGLCTLTKVSTDATTGEVSVVPVARSYESHKWEKAAGVFSSDTFDSEFNCIVGLCAIPLSSLGEGESYVLSSYEYTADPVDENARFLEMTTFGTRKSDLDNWNYVNYASWVSEQIEAVPMTSHRAYWRERLNPRCMFSQDVGRSNHPCDPNSRWRRFAFTEKDRYKIGAPVSGSIYIKNTTVSGGPYILFVDGHARTVVDNFEWRSGDMRDRFPTWDPDFAYQICQTPEEFIGGSLYLNSKPFEGEPNGDCDRVRYASTGSTANPPINFPAGFEDYLGRHVFNLDLSDTLTNMDSWKDLMTPTNDDMYMLENGLDDPKCDEIPEQAEDFDAPVFATHPTAGLLIWDPRLILEKNVEDQPLSDGGGAIQIGTASKTICSNAPRTFLNAEGCALSTEETACETIKTPDISIVLDSENILQLFNLTGRYTYAIQGLMVKQPAFGEEVDHPCTTGVRSRWEKTPTCNPTSPAETEQALSQLLSASTDSNPYLRDITFPSGMTCANNDNEVEIEIQVGADCWKHVHPEHLSVFDMTYWTLPNTHPGNQIAESQGHPHPITKWLDGGSHTLVFPSTHPDFPHSQSRWDTHYEKFERVGRYGDTVLYKNLPNELRLEQVVEYYGVPEVPEGNGVVVCGSPGEVANDPTKGSHFDLQSEVVRDTTFRGNLARQREIVWTMAALYSQDQLRQRMAWALSQIFALAKEAITVEERNTETFLQYYDIFVRNAFGVFMDVLREISYSPLMAENLSYMESKSQAYVLETSQRVEFADENFAREIMQLFTTGLILLNVDGTPKRDGLGNPQQVYTNADIRSIARVWTGFKRQEHRGNIETFDGRNRLDPMAIDAEWHDRFPKSNLYDGYIGDGYPLCIDLPERQFLRLGAKYRLLGRTPLPELMTDHAELTERFVLEESTSSLRSVLCQMENGACQFPMEVTLDTNLDCNNLECEVDTVRVVQVAPGVFYEYVAPACVEHPFYNNAMKLNLKRDNDLAICANPLLPAAASACCEEPRGSWLEAVNASLYEIERMTFATQDARCVAANFQSCEYSRVDAEAPGYLSNEVYRWAVTDCEIQVKVNPDGEAAIVHNMPGDPDTVLHVDESTTNFFQVAWDSDFPQASDNCGACTLILGNNCLCDTTVQETQVFTEDPPDATLVLAQLHIGAPNPSSLDSTVYTSSTAVNGFIVHQTSGGYDLDTIIEVTDNKGQTFFLKNVKSTVLVDGGHSFRNPVHFMSLVPSETNARDIQYEVDALLQHLVYHDNTAPFLCIRFIQRFGISNPTPRYVKECSNAFQSGLYESGGETFGSSNYGDLAATVASIVLDREARSVVLDVDPFQGSLREPLLRVISLMRSMEFAPLDAPGAPPMVTFAELDERIGQMAHESPSVFSFFRSEYAPEGPVSDAQLVSPEAQLLDMPNTVELLLGLQSLIKFGLSSCDYGFGFDRDNTDSLPCVDDGSYSRATGILTYVPSSAATAAGTQGIVQELSTLVTCGRLGYDARQALVAAYDKALAESGSAASALRLTLLLLSTTPEFHTTNTIKLSGQPRPQPPPPVAVGGVPYRAVVMLMFAGGCDSFNMLVPKDCTSSAYTQYVNARRPLHLNQEQLLPIDGSSQPAVGCSNFGIHEELPIVKQLYDDDQLLFFANTGVLATPTSSKETFADDTPIQLFAHNTMQKETQEVDVMDAAKGTGVLGRMVDALNRDALSVGSTSIVAPSNALVGKTQPPISVGANGVTRFEVNAAGMTETEFMDQVSNFNNDTKQDSGVFAQTWSESMLRSLNQNEVLASAMNAASVTRDFGDSDLGRHLQVVTRLIKARADRARNADVFFVEFGGWDMHSDLSPRLRDNFQDVNQALSAFVGELQDENVWDQTTVVQVSDFARTLTPNSGGGTDHAWGGNYFMFGGDVKGGKIVGEFPADLGEGGDLNLGRGRFLPTTGWDQIWPGIAKWMGVSDEEDLNDICPNRASFIDSEFSVDDLFWTTETSPPSV